jgi:DNA repair photolyase
VLVAPILPGISDHPDQLKAVVDAVADAGATHISGIALHLRPGVKEEFMPWLEREHPDLVDSYRRMYGRGSNAPKQVRETISGRIKEARELAATRAEPTWRIPTGPREAHARRPFRELPKPPPSEQLDLGFGG